jgi:putative transposase
LIRTDTIDLLVSKIVHGTDGRDSDGATGPTGEPAQLYPWRRYVFADGGYAGAS